jgi:mannose-1-phosphate guanylyltransferase
MGDIYPVIMAGGKGTRFWPLSREARPKQLLSIVGDASMIAQTVARLAPLAPPERVIVITGASHADAIRAELPDVPAANVVAEPVGRNTAPCIGLAAALVAARDPEGIMAVFPADHAIGKPDELLAVIDRVTAHIERNPSLLATVGITPSFAETGYGYIRTGGPAAPGILAVEAFCEKPNKETAQRYVASGDYLWNAGMFFWKATTVADQIARHMPELDAALMPLKEAVWTERFAATMAAVYPTLPAESIDYGIMEKAGAAGNVVVAPADPGWSDVGSWRSLYDLTPPDADGNRARGEVIAVDATGTLVHNGKRLVALVGVDDIVVVETDDAILVVHKDRTQDVKAVVDELARRKRNDLL